MTTGKELELIPEPDVAAVVANRLQLEYDGWRGMTFDQKKFMAYFCVTGDKTEAANLAKVPLSRVKDWRLKAHFRDLMDTIAYTPTAVVMCMLDDLVVEATLALGQIIRGDDQRAKIDASRMIFQAKGILNKLPNEAPTVVIKMFNYDKPESN